MTYCLHGDYIQSHCVPGYCQSLCLHDTCGFWWEGFLCHHCVAFFYRVFVTGQGQHSKIQSYRFVIFHKYVDDSIVPFTNRSNVKIRSQILLQLLYGDLWIRSSNHIMQLSQSPTDKMAWHFLKKNIRNRFTFNFFFGIWQFFIRFYSALVILTAVTLLPEMF